MGKVSEKDFAEMSGPPARARRPTDAPARRRRRLPRADRKRSREADGRRRGRPTSAGVPDARTGAQACPTRACRMRQPRTTPTRSSASGAARSWRPRDDARVLLLRSGSWALESSRLLASGWRPPRNAGSVADSRARASGAELPDGTVTVRVVREAIGNDAPGQTVRVTIGGSDAARPRPTRRAAPSSPACRWREARRRDGRRRGARRRSRLPSRRRRPARDSRRRHGRAPSAKKQEAAQAAAAPPEGRRRPRRRTAA